MTIQLFLADDHQLFREGLRMLLERNPEFSVIGEAEDGNTAVEEIINLKPDVVLMDIAMPGLNGIDAIRQINLYFEHIKSVILTMHCEPQLVREALQAGASGYLLKESATADLVTAIRQVAEGQIYLSPRISDFVLKDYIQQLSDTNENDPSSQLTAREKEIWQLLAEGSTSAEIADQLCVSIRTVETHRKNLMTKLGVRSLAELVKLALRSGVTSLDA